LVLVVSNIFQNPFFASWAVISFFNHPVTSESKHFLRDKVEVFYPTVVNKKNISQRVTKAQEMGLQSNEDFRAIAFRD
jgi:hypothetical protein